MREQTLAAIRRVFEELLLERDYNKITVKEICERVGVNRKTFYRYYETLDFLMEEVADEFLNAYLSRIEGYRLPEDLEQINREFFTWSSAQSEVYERLVCAASYNRIGGKMIGRSIKAAWRDSAEYQSLGEQERRLLLTFIYNVGLELYRRWVFDGKVMPLEKIIALSNDLLCRGVEGFFGGKNLD